jgi:hypothetical protein
MLRLISQSANDPLHHLTVGNELVHCKFPDAWRENLKTPVINFGERTLAIIWTTIIRWSSALTLDDHIMYDHIGIYDFSHVVCRPLKSRVSDNKKSSLKHTKYNMIL